MVGTGGMNHLRSLGRFRSRGPRPLRPCSFTHPYRKYGGSGQDEDLYSSVSGSTKSGGPGRVTEVSESKSMTREVFTPRVIHSDKTYYVSNNL